VDVDRPNAAERDKARERFDWESEHERGQVDEVIKGGWNGLNGYGLAEPGLLPNLTALLLKLFKLMGEAYFAKFHAPFTLLFLGNCAWFLCRQLGLGKLAAVLANGDV
jgi:hypothetical protein